MNKLLKYLRIAGGILLLSNIYSLFLPVLKITQKNYPTHEYRRLEFFKEFLGNINIGESVVQLQSSQYMKIFLFIILPLVLSFIFGVTSIVSDNKNIIFGVADIVVGVLSLIFFLDIKDFGKIYKKKYETVETQSAIYIILAIAVALMVTGLAIVIITLIKNRGIVSKPQDAPDIIRIQNEEDNNQDANDITEEVQIPPYDPQMGPRGVMVGISGMYAGAEIPFADGECIKFGRDSSNDMIFVNSPKVSRFHCSITWDKDEEEYEVIDTSSNGCFVNYMDECIPQNIPIRLELGTIIDIGDEKNRFRLE